MDKELLDRDGILREIERAASQKSNQENQTRLLFLPRKITGKNLSSVCCTYSQIQAEMFETVVIVESAPGEAEKKLPMPSFSFIETEFGKVNANIRLRNDFADEDDDFFVNDNAFDEDSVLHEHLPFLQAILDDFSILHIQITDERLPIIKELSTALQEILPSRKALLVCCCDLPDTDLIHEMQDLIENDEHSALMNRVNQRNFNYDGMGSFIAGMFVARKWGLKIYFEPDHESVSAHAGYAVVKNQVFFG